jgi:hypothetical protein
MYETETRRAKYSAARLWPVVCQAEGSRVKSPTYIEAHMASAKKKPPKPKKAAARKPVAKKAVLAKTKSVRSVSILKRMPRPSLMSQLTSSVSPGQKLPLRLQVVVDKSEIADLLYRFARGIDRIDETLLRSIYHPDATVDLGPGIFQGTANDYVHWVLSVLHQVRSSHHAFSNIHAQLNGDVALVESYCHAHFRLDKPTGREDVFMGSRYLDRMERRPSGPAGVWKIVHRKQVLDWVRTEAVSDIFYHQNPDALWSYRTKTDPSYHMAQFPGSQSSSKLPAFLGRRYESKSIRF